MTILLYILFFSFLGSIVSLLGGVLLLMREKFAIKTAHLLSAFAAGTLLGTAFFDLLPEALEAAEGQQSNIFFWTFAGIAIFFLIERFIHHHNHSKSKEERDTIVPLIVVGDTLHNFIDGVAMAATFLISVPLGIVTSLAVAIHEIPQEIGDFGLMLHKGVKKSKILLINFFSALAAMLGAVVTYWAKDDIEGLLPAVLGITSGFFIYIALSNLIPEIHDNENQKTAFWETVLLFVGVATVWIVISLLEGRA